MLRAVPLTEPTPPPQPTAPRSASPRPSRPRIGLVVALAGSLLLHVAMREIWRVWEQRQPPKIEQPKVIEVTLTPPPPPPAPPKPIAPPPPPPPPPKPKVVVKPVPPVVQELPKPRPIPPAKPKPLPKPPKPKPPPEPEPEPAPRELDDLAPPEEFKEPEPPPKPRPIRRRIPEPIPEPPREPEVEREPEAEPEPPPEVKAPPRPAPPAPAPAPVRAESAARPRSDLETAQHRPSAEVATGGQNSAPVVIARPKPRYPGIAQQRHWEGRVLVRLRVSADGNPSDCEVAESSGHDILDEAARDSVCETWRFKPALRDGKPVEYQATQPVVFKLE